MTPTPDNDNTRRTIHDYIGSLAIMPNETKSMNCEILTNAHYLFYSGLQKGFVLNWPTICDRHDLQFDLIFFYYINNYVTYNKNYCVRNESSRFVLDNPANTLYYHSNILAHSFGILLFYGVHVNLSQF